MKRIVSPKTNQVATLTIPYPARVAVLSKEAIYRLRSEPFSRGIPQYESDKANSGPFETHVKLRDPENADAISGWLGEWLRAGPQFFSALLLGKVGIRGRDGLNVFAFILDSHVQALKHTKSASDIQGPPSSYCGYPRVYQSRINRFSSIRMNGAQESIHNRYKTWAN